MVEPGHFHHTNRVFPGSDTRRNVTTLLLCGIHPERQQFVSLRQKYGQIFVKDFSYSERQVYNMVLIISLPLCCL